MYIISKSTLLLFFFAISVATIYYASSNTYALSPESKSQTNNTDFTAVRFPTLSVATDRIKYVEGQSITITGTIYDQQGKPVKSPINVKVQEMFLNESKFKEDNNTKTEFTLATGRTVYGVNLIPNNGTYNVVIDRGLMSGKYNITSYISYATANQNKIDIQPGTSTIIYVDSFFNSTPVRTFIIGAVLGGLGTLLLVILNERYSHKRVEESVSVSDKTKSEDIKDKLDSKKTKRAHIKRKTTDDKSPFYEFGQFLIITIFAFTPIATLAFTDVAIFPNSPIGVVIKPSSEKVSQSAGEWMINVGGSSFDRYQSGIQIPIAIFIFGILGGYLKYLYSSEKTKGRRE